MPVKNCCDLIKVMFIDVLGYDGGGVMVQGATGEAPTDKYKVTLLVIIITTV